ncbi:MAG: ion channel [Methyloceanibacter sp.]
MGSPKMRAKDHSHSGPLKPGTGRTPDRARRELFRRLQERLRDPLLTGLTILIALLMFVIAPLHAGGAIESQDVGLAVGLVVIGAVAFETGITPAVVVMLVALGLAATATLLRLQHRSPLDLYLDASAWILLGFAMSWVVARAVFAPGRITYHRIMGAILLYLVVGLTFVALYTFVGLLIPDAFSGMTVKDGPALASTMIYFSFGTLTTAGSGDIAPLHPIARSLCNVEAMIGQLYPATLLARLVTLEIEGEDRG